MLPTAYVEPRVALEAAAAYSETLMGWVLLVLGGSVVALLQRSYLRPESRSMRLTYLLFVLGWAFLARSIFFGTRVQQVLLAFLFQRNPNFSALRNTLNKDLLKQVRNLEYGLLAFGLWLAVYLVWWIFTKQGFGAKD